METSREDVSIAIRSAFLRKGAQQRFSLFALIVFAIFLIFIDTFQAKPLNFLRSIVKDSIYRGSALISYPSKSIKLVTTNVKNHINLFTKYQELKKENELLLNKISNSDYLFMENSQLRNILDDHKKNYFNLSTSKVIIDKQSPYLNSFIINSGGNKKIKKGMAVLDGQNFIGRIVDVNFFSSRVLLVSDLNSKIPVIVEPGGYHALLSGTGTDEPILEYLPEDHAIALGNKVYTSGKEGIFSPGIPIGLTKLDNKKISISLFSRLNQITYVNVSLNYEVDK